MAEAQLRTFMYEYIHRSPSKRSRGVQASNSPLKTIEPKTHNLNPSIEFRQISAHTNMYSPISTSPSKPVKAIEVGTETTDEIIDYVTGKVVKRRAEKSLDKIMYTNHLKFKTLQEAVEDIKVKII